MWLVDLYRFVLGSTKASTGTAEAIPGKTESKDDNLAFVAGATGRVGSRTVRYTSTSGFQFKWV